MLNWLFDVLSALSSDLWPVGTALAFTWRIRTHPAHAKNELTRSKLTHSLVWSTAAVLFGALAFYAISELDQKTAWMVSFLVACLIERAVSIHDFIRVVLRGEPVGWTC